MVAHNIQNRVMQEISKIFGSSFRVESLKIVFLKVINAVILFVSYLVLARVLGAENLGVYAWIVALVSVLTVLARLGVDELLTRDMALQMEGDIVNIKGLFCLWRKKIFLFSVGLLIFVSGVTWGNLGGLEWKELFVYLFGFLLIPLQSLLVLHQTALRSRGFSALGLVPEMLIQPGVFLFCFGGFYLFQTEISALDAIISLLVGALVALFVAHLLVWEKLSFSKTMSYLKQDWVPFFKKAAPFVLISGMVMVNDRTDILMIGFLLDKESVGLYSVASRGAEILLFFWAAAAIPLAPRLASLYGAGNIPELTRLLKKASLTVFFPTLAVAVLLGVFNKFFLGLYGSQFTVAATAFLMLLCARLVQSGLGFSGVALNMTGCERFTAWGLFLGLLLNISLNFLLIPLFSINGAAFATAISTLFWNLWHAFWLYRRHGVTLIGYAGVFEKGRPR